MQCNIPLGIALEHVANITPPPPPSATLQVPIAVQDGKEGAPEVRSASSRSPIFVSQPQMVIPGFALYISTHSKSMGVACLRRRDWRKVSPDRTWRRLAPLVPWVQVLRGM